MTTSLIITRYVTWTRPHSLEELALLQTYQAAQEAENADLAEELLPTLPKVRQYRFTVGTASVLGMARYQSSLRLSTQWIEQRFGKRISEIETTSDAEEDLEPVIYLNAAYGWAIVRASVKSVESRVSGDEDGAWTAEKLPELESFEQYLEFMPDELRRTLERLAQELNPQLWSWESDASSKKLERISVS